MSLSHALSLADSVRRQLDCGSRDPQNRAVTADEIAAGEVEKKKAQALLSSSISVVNNALTALRKAAPPDAKSVARRSKGPLGLARTKGTAPYVSRKAEPSILASNDPALDSVMKDMSADGLAPGAGSLTDMANAIKPIMDKFDTVLKAPHLDSFSATLNTVPVVGLKDNNIVYIESKPSVTSGGGITYNWSFFSALPSDAKVTAGNAVHFFPYKGDFYLSVGASVWKKAHISEKDPAIQQAVDNWPALYVKEWTPIGDNVLPASDLVDVIPFARLSADRDEIAFQLVTLATDGSLSFLTTDTLIPNAKYEALSYKSSSGSPSSPPLFTKAAYWDGHIVAVDDQSNSWNITPNWDNGTYTIADKVSIDAVTEFTANDSGPVGLRSDGYLWQRYVQPPPDGSKDDATLQWKRWIKADGVANLGVASPGVMLDMLTLTRTLRSRYIDVQTSVYPVVNKLSAFGKTHLVYLRNVSKDADDYINATTDEQRALAIKNAKAFVAHAKTWSTIVSKSISGAKESVNIMTKQLHDVRVQLEQQLQLLKDKLVGLKASLSVQQEALSKLTAAFWGTVAAMFFGVIVFVAGTIMANPWIMLAGGALFVGGLAATIYLAVQMSQLAASISDTEAQIRDVTTAIEELTVVVQSFTDLDTLYGTLNMFWGRMANNASDIKDMDEATAAQIGAEILEDKSSIQASQEVTQEIVDACQTYLDVLNEQGIIIPDDASVAVSRSIPHEKLLDSALSEAHRALLKQDAGGYLERMREAAVAHILAQAETARTVALAGAWFDVPALSSTASIWMNGSRPFTSSVDIPSSIRNAIDAAIRAIVGYADSLDGSLDEARPYVQQMLNDIIGLGETIQGWTAKYPTIPTDPDDVAAVEKLQDKAVKTCEGAQNKARLANNKFATFTNEAREYQQGLDRQIQSSEDAKTSKTASANEEIRNLSPPWYVYLGGLAAVTIWLAVEEQKIRDRLSGAIRDLNNSIAQFKQMRQSGVEFNGKAQTWIEMSQTVSGNLGEIYNILTGVWGQLLENPILYADFMRTEWGQIVDNARDVLQILGGSTRAVASAPAVSKVSSESDKQRVMQAVLPAPALGSGIGAQAASAQDTFNKLDLLLKSPYLDSIIGYWDEGKTERNTLLDVVTSLRTEYVQMVATEYDTIQQISSLALLQEYRAKNVADGTLPLDNFVKFTSQSVQTALAAAEKTSGKFGDAADRFAFVLRVINENIDSVVKQISDLDTKIDETDAKIREKIAWIVADAIAILFASAALLVAFGVVGPVGAAVGLFVKIGAGAAATAAGIKLVIDSISLADLVTTVEALKALRNDLTTSVENLKAVQPLFGDVVKGVNGITSTISGMEDSLNEVLKDLGVLGEITFTAEDAEKVKEAWVKVRDEAHAWMDIINAQGISPITLSVKNN